MRWLDSMQFAIIAARFALQQMLSKQRTPLSLHGQYDKKFDVAFMCCCQPTPCLIFNYGYDGISLCSWGQ
jgi:hypothetical protein